MNEEYTVLQQKMSRALIEYDWNPHPLPAQKPSFWSVGVGLSIPHIDEIDAEQNRGKS